jgi:predicted nucleotidyltransferase
MAGLEPARMSVMTEMARWAAGLDLLLVFGSRARGDAHDRSDWDLGFLGSAAFDADAFRAQVIEMLGTDRVDLVDLARAGGLLRYRAARDGHLVFESRPGIDDAFRLEAAQFWCDAGPILQRGYEDVLAGLPE